MSAPRTLYSSPRYPENQNQQNHNSQSRENTLENCQSKNTRKFFPVMNLSFLFISGTKGGLNLRAFPDNNVEKEEGDRKTPS